MPKNLLDTQGDVRVYHTLEDGKNHISYEQDVEAALEFAHAAREEIDQTGKDVVSYVRLPDSIVLELKFKHGLDLLQKMTPTDEKRLYHLLETDYAKFKLTPMKMWRPT